MQPTFFSIVKENAPAVTNQSLEGLFKSLYRKRANTPCSCMRLALRASDTTLRLPGTDPRSPFIDSFRIVDYYRPIL